MLSGMSAVDITSLGMIHYLMTSTTHVYLEKALQSVAGAESELVNGRLDNCANRCYYACFQAAIYALIRAGIKPKDGKRPWRHMHVHAMFVHELIGQRERYPAELRDVLSRTLMLRQQADYTERLVSAKQAGRALRKADAFVTAVEQLTKTS